MEVSERSKFDTPEDLVSYVYDPEKEQEDLESKLMACQARAHWSVGLTGFSILVPPILFEICRGASPRVATRLH